MARSRMNSQERMIEELAREIESAQKEISKWAAELSTNPLHAFEWSDGTFEEAATVTVASRMVNMLGDVGTVNERGNFVITFEMVADRIYKTLMQKVVSNSRYPARSTSVASNLAAAADAQACARLLERYFFSEE